MPLFRKRSHQPQPAPAGRQLGGQIIGIALGSALMGIGLALTFTLIGGLIGIPLFIIGLVVLVKTLAPQLA